MKVRTLRAHGNAYGERWNKAVDAEYDHPDELAAGALVDTCVVVPVPDTVPTDVDRHG